jgi:hypothetical protein
MRGLTSRGAEGATCNVNRNAGPLAACGMACGGAILSARARAMEPWSHGAMEPRSHGAKEPRSHGAMEPWSQGAKEPRSHGAKEPWSHGAKERALAHGGYVGLRAVVHTTLTPLSFVSRYRGVVLVRYISTVETRICRRHATVSGSSIVRSRLGSLGESGASGSASLCACGRSRHMPRG